MAEKIKEKMGDAINLSIFTNDSMEAMKYKIRSATSVYRKRGATSPGDGAFRRKIRGISERALDLSEIRTSSIH